MRPNKVKTDSEFLIWCNRLMYGIIRCWWSFLSKIFYFTSLLFQQKLLRKFPLLFAASKIRLRNLRLHFAALKIRLWIFRLRFAGLKNWLRNMRLRFHGWKIQLRNLCFASLLFLWAKLCEIGKGMRIARASEIEEHAQFARAIKWNI